MNTFWKKTNYKKTNNKEKEWKRVITYDSKGNEIENWEEINFKNISKELGSTKNYDWNLMMKEGIDPTKTTPKTSGNNRIENYNKMKEFTEIGEKIINDINNTNKTN